jgi:hypothetical protein
LEYRSRCVDPSRTETSSRFAAGPEDFHDVHTRARAFSEAACEVVAHGEYDVGYRFLDVESLVFWLKAVPTPFDPELEWRQVHEIIARTAARAA